MRRNCMRLQHNSRLVLETCGIDDDTNGRLLLWNTTAIASFFGAWAMGGGGLMIGQCSGGSRRRWIRGARLPLLGFGSRWPRPRDSGDSLILVWPYTSIILTMAHSLGWWCATGECRRRTMRCSVVVGIVSVGSSSIGSIDGSHVEGGAATATTRSGSSSSSSSRWIRLTPYCSCC